MEGDNKNVKKPNSEICSSMSLDTDTSILDFKSPKIKPIEEIKLFNFKSIKSKKRLNVNDIVDNKADTSKQVERKISNNVHIQTVSNISCNQEDRPTHMPNNTTIAYVCPLCFKNHKDNNSRIFHMKACAIKNKISMKKLLQAMKLQERQAAERVSLGLPVAPILQNKKQGSVQKTTMNQDSHLQLALALSKSLYEVEEIKNSGQVGQEFSAENARHSVENITSRIQRKKKQSSTSILQIRTQEERDRLLTDKIAEILIDSETLIQRQQQAKNKNENRQKDSLKSCFLKKFLNFDNQLWNAAMLQSSQTDFFVKDLSPFIIPSVQKQSFVENINESIMKKPQQIDKLPITCDSYLNKDKSSNISHRMDVKLFADMRKENVKQSCINNLIVDWGNALNDSSSSDVIIFINGDKQIWVHKLVFYVRCPNILLDIIPNENTTYAVKEKICWTDVEYYIALAFLEFIYCGIIEKYPIFSNDSVAISSLGYLARRYKVKELFPYLRHLYVVSPNSDSMNNEFEVGEQSIQEIVGVNHEQNKLTLTADRESNVIKCNNQDTLDITTMEVSQNQFLKTNMSSPERCTVPDMFTHRENSMSPDIFDDIDNVTLNLLNNAEFVHIENSKNNIGYDLLSPNQRNLKDIATNKLLSPSRTNKHKNSTNECIRVTPSINQPKQALDTMADKVKPKSDLTLFIEEVQKENAKSDFEIDPEIGSPPKLFTQYNRNPFRKAEYNECSIVLDRFDNSNHSPPKIGKKISSLSKLESDLQIYAIENPQLCNITMDENPKFTIPVDCTDLYSPMKEVNITTACNDKTLETITQENNVSMTTSYCSSSEIETDDANISMYTKYKSRHINNSIAIYRSAVKKHKNNVTKIEFDKKENNDEIIEIDRANNFSRITKCTYSDMDHTRNEQVNVASLSNVTMDEDSNIIQIEKNTLNLEFLRKSINEEKIYNAFKDDDSTELDNLNNGSYCDSDSVKTQVIRDETFNHDCSSIKLSEFPDIEKQCSTFSPEIDLTSADNHDFSKYDNDHVTILKTQEFDNESQYFFLNTASFLNVNIKNNIGSIALEDSQLQICRKNKKSRKRSRSEGSLQYNYNIEKDCEIYDTPSQKYSTNDNYKSNATNNLLTITKSHSISPPNYDIMDTPELHREMKKYGLKIQKRQKSIKLLTYIYNELHPIISSCEILGLNVKNVDNNDEEPRKKKQKNTKDYAKTAKTVAVLNTNVENVIALNDCGTISEAFFKLLQFNKDLHNSILRYEPVNLKLIHCMLKTGGFKCNVKTLIDFLDEQCITFHSPENKTRIRTRKIHS